MGERDTLLFEGAEWNFDDLHRAYDAIEAVAVDDLGLDLFRNQIEIISSEQMLDAYSSIGMPLMYRHWSFGKHFIQHEQAYRKGARGLAFEIVINSNPCICYCLEDNTMALQALVIAHAAFGHNHFFKNNYAFQQWTDPDGILDELGHARDFVSGCEERYGRTEVERILDAAHALMPASVFRHARPSTPTQRQADERERLRTEEAERARHYLWDTMLPRADATAEPEPEDERRRTMHLPEENLLYFVERHGPALLPWQREILAIVRRLAQYFYPQRQTKIMNEGCATFVHYEIMQRLHQAGRIDDGAMLEILHNHANVLTQPSFDSPYYGGLNPYTLGFAMMRDIKRVCLDPDEEDRAWFPDIAGCRDWRGVLKDAWANYRDESFVRQYLGPRVMRDLRLFTLEDDTGATHYTVTAIHDERGYQELREALAASCEPLDAVPDIQVVDADLQGDRVLRLEHRAHDGRPLDAATREATLEHLRTLWRHGVVLDERAS